MPGFISEKNITEHSNEVTISIASKEVEGYRSKGTGVIVNGTARFIKSGDAYDRLKKKFDWARASWDFIFFFEWISAWPSRVGSFRSSAELRKSFVKT